MAGMLAQAQPQGRKATPQEQQAYKNIVTQVIKYLAQPESAQVLEEMASRKSPAEALAFVVLQALQGVGMAAKKAGIDVANHTGQAAIGEILNVMANMMKMGGLIDDVAGTVQQATQIIMAGGQQAQQQQPAQPAPQGV